MVVIKQEQENGALCSWIAFIGLIIFLFLLVLLLFIVMLLSWLFFLHCLYAWFWDYLSSLQVQRAYDL